MSLCPCNSKREYSECCEPILEGVPTTSLEAVVRARYTAFVVHKVDYVDDTHAPEVKDDFNRAEVERMADECEWHGMEIGSISQNGINADVEYSIQFRREKQFFSKKMISSFRCENGKWLFVSSQACAQAPIEVAKIGRNDPCSCGSGKKAKKCCGTLVGQK